MQIQTNFNYWSSKTEPAKARTLTWTTSSSGTFQRRISIPEDTIDGQAQVANYQELCVTNLTQTVLVKLFYTEFFT